ncbi:hexapeptide repeat-containing transferas-like protein [Emiliania huxleyi CCMP1516]|uniref:Gamma carbonic anhydrase family protein n=2 Tax=Emiliania huxleyi TaxID=2903 RepID=A0A0D3IJD0_EMIH1|nr:hexapeptide repeat-containing transferas-like protein [Emiliania huxleyi CCMP1516]EOD11365.1 hexapeptide repeat-containing transferas-like protein [Emiliania huxleyi CCMP1516]|eukprot:XP_005763794.1 hexapeptide repeat-containing transferas-like protein [Emiliania huxleyi CCMP1516]
MGGAFTLGRLKPMIAATAWIAPNAHLVGNVVLRDRASIWFGVVVRGDNPEPITIGERTNVQENSVLHADAGVPLTLGNDVTVGHCAMLHGCTIGERRVPRAVAGHLGDNSLIGIGATVLNKAVVGKNCLIGAHALVIPDGSLVIGAPAKVVRTLTEDQIKGAQP